jgi:hypothetical protein
MNREREKMAHWYSLQKNQKLQKKPPEKIFCKICHKEIKPDSLPQLKHGVGIICYDCYKKDSKLYRKNKKN